jgi:hypothetical protein
MIKKIVLIAAMGAMGLLWGAGDVTIQVINAVKESSITPEFDQKLKKSGLAVHKVVEGGRYIVTLGTYKDEKSAQKALKQARKIVAAGAFVRFVKRDQTALSAHEPIKSTAVKSAAIAAVAASHETVKTQQTAIAPVEVKSSAATGVQEHAVVAVIKPMATAEVKSCPIVKESVISASDKKEAYKSEIAEAINYYKNSPYHRFEPVMLQP